MSSISVDFRGLPEIRKLLGEFDDRQINNRTRRALRAGAKVMREGLRDEARSRSDLPKSFRVTRTRSHRNPMGVSVAPKSPLSPIFEHGAKRHEIAPGKMTVSGRHLLLAGPAGERWRARAFLASMPVSHPGMGARPFIAPVFAAKQQATEKAVADTLFEGL
jgi:hypothetical protein